MKGFLPSSTVLADQPGQLVPKCGACGLYKKCKSPKLPYRGEGERRILIVGDQPTEYDDKCGSVFNGGGAEYLRDVVEDLGYDLDRDCWMTNSIICHNGTHKAPDSKQVSHCHPNLVSTINELKPRVVISMGQPALKSILSGKWDRVDTIEKWTGWVIPLQDHWLCPTWFASFVKNSKDRVMQDEFMRHIKAAFAIDKEPLKRPDRKARVITILDDGEAARAIRAMHNHNEWIAVDYETNCLKPEYPDAEIKSCALSAGEMAISYPWHGQAIEATGKLLKHKKTWKIASNLKMEEKWTRAEFDHGVRNWGWDTMIAAHCLDNRPGICGLKFQALVNLGEPSYNDRIEPYLSSSGWYNRIEHIDLKELLVYGGMDALLEYDLAMKQMTEMGYDV